MTSRRIPVACNLELSELGRRQQQWTSLMRQALIKKQATPRGVSLIFDRKVEHELKRLAAAERECCGFASWVVTQAPGGGLSLEVEADGMGADAVRAMFE